MRMPNLNHEGTRREYSDTCTCLDVFLTPRDRIPDDLLIRFGFLFVNCVYTKLPEPHAAVAMDIAGGIVKSISTSLLTRGTINMVEGVRSCFPDLNLPPPTVVSTRIPNLFGDQFPEQLLAIQHIINEKLQDIQDVILQEFRSKNWCEQYNTVLQAIYVVQKKYKAFESAPNGFTWNEFRNESQKFNPASQMDWLLTKITTTSVSWENLLEQLTTLCGTDFELYKQWDTAIRLAFSEAYRLRLTYLMHCAFSEANYIRNDPLSTNNTTREELEQTVL
ncbi:hypothetical protein BV898_10566 [Hypsibius exemplaris]|uniref:Uncharacterized protein n=1 Tax=Hypsibius exemplaris TaxID=2072580 RepID=A0A1W0WIY1_HYPEX|nr:hypothetical protein BV898_10566 [Hypsibius exemplaris]